MKKENKTDKNNNNFYIKNTNYVFIETPIAVVTPQSIINKKENTTNKKILDI